MSVAMIVVVIAVYCLIAGRFGLFINNATMLFLTVVTVPVIQHHVTFVGAVVSLIAGAAFFCGLIVASTYLGHRQQA